MRINSIYNFSDIKGDYKLIGIVGSTNYEYATAVFYCSELNKRRRLKVNEAKRLLRNDS